MAKTKSFADGKTTKGVVITFGDQSFSEDLPQDSTTFIGYTVGWWMRGHSTTIPDLPRA